MDELFNILRKHAGAYPLMQPCDAIKLIFQNEFGAEHIISDEEQCLKKLQDEYSSKKFGNSFFLEDIGNSNSRLYLTSIDNETLPVDCVNKIFIASSKHTNGNKDSFRKKLETLKDAVKQNVFGFSHDSMQRYFVRLKESGYPAVSHSIEYKREYNPAYRVIHKTYSDILSVIKEINRLINKKGNAVVAIDGYSASGKTSLAESLKRIFESNIIHTDDFFLPQELRSKERYSEAGGNIHYERFMDEVILPLRNSESFEYRKYDCLAGNFTEKIMFDKKRLTIIEGSYSLHPKFQNYYDLSVFLSIGKAEQMERIQKRNPENSKDFFELWIPLENEYFKHYGIWQKCDFTIKR